MIKHFFSKQFIKFLFVGVSAAAINWLSRIILNFWMTFSIAVILAYLIGMTTAFILNKIFVFPKSKKETKKQMRDFILTNLFFLPIVWISSIGIKLLLQRFNISYAAEISHLIALSIPMLATFLIYKLIAFKESKHD